MRTVCEFRILEEHAGLVLDPGDGKQVSDSLREIVVDINSGLFADIGRIHRKLRQESNQWLFHWWDIRHTYTKQELETAELFHFETTGVFEPEGEGCGTIYDYSEECAECGAGRRRTSDLILDLRRAPKSKDIARTLANDEWVVSQRLAELMVEAGLTGFELRPAKHKARHQDDPYDLATVPTGQEILRRAKKADCPYSEWEFWVWLNKPEQRELSEKARAEYVAMAEKKDKRRGRPVPTWYELIITSKRVPMVPPTRAGAGPFDEDPEGKYRCPLGHVIGLNLLSEVHVERSEWDGSDIVCTENMVGCRRGVLVPAPLMLISPRFWRLLRNNKIKGYSTDVAYLM